MAHFHLVSIHPFHDGNGRLARVLQALVLARGTGLPAELCSIEGSLAANTAGYYAALTRSREVGTSQTATRGRGSISA